MPQISTSPLLEYLQSEVQAQSESKPAPSDNTGASSPIRVPLEVDGTVWSAEVEKMTNDRLSLIVDREALHRMHEHQEGAIRFQPDNSAMLSVPGRITSDGFMESNRVRLNFKLG